MAGVGVGVGRTTAFVCAFLALLLPSLSLASENKRRVDRLTGSTGFGFHKRDGDKEAKGFVFDLVLSRGSSPFQRKLKIPPYYSPPGSAHQLSLQPAAKPSNPRSDELLNHLRWQANKVAQIQANAAKARAASKSHFDSATGRVVHLSQPGLGGQELLTRERKNGARVSQHLWPSQTQPQAKAEVEATKLELERGKGKESGPGIQKRSLGAISLASREASDGSSGGWILAGSVVACSLVVAIGLALAGLMIYTRRAARKEAATMETLPSLEEEFQRRRAAYAQSRNGNANGNLSCDPRQPRLVPGLARDDTYRLYHGSVPDDEDFEDASDDLPVDYSHDKRLIPAPP